MRLRDMRGLGPKSEEQLNAIGIRTPEDLQRMGAVPAFAALRAEAGVNASLNFLFALVGALEDRDWREVARQDRGRLLNELEGYSEMQRLFAREANDQGDD